MAELLPGDLLTHLHSEPAQSDRAADSWLGRLAVPDISFQAFTEAPVEVPITSLLPADTPRFGRPDPEHAMALAEVGPDLPPVLVRRQSMRVIDGMHRLGAVELRGDRTIRARFFDGSEEEAFLLAVSLNVTHGLPLKIAERRSAAQRIVKLRPDMSDRSIARIAGLAAKTVAGIRRSASEDVPQLDNRLGSDGRWRPLRPAEGRRIAGELFVEQPEAPLRRIARQAGISVGTARDVRERVRRGEDPTPPRQRPGSAGSAGEAIDRRASGGVDRPSAPVDQRALLGTLQRDPSLLYSDAGRSLLRWLGTRVGEPHRLGEDPSAHPAALRRPRGENGPRLGGGLDGLRRRPSASRAGLREQPRPGGCRPGSEEQSWLRRHPRDPVAGQAPFEHAVGEPPRRGRGRERAVRRRGRGRSRRRGSRRRSPVVGQFGEPVGAARRAGC